MSDCEPDGREIDVADAATVVSGAAWAAEQVGANPSTTRKVRTVADVVKGGTKVAEGVVAVGAAASAATGLTVAATSGAGIAAGLAAAGGIGGMAAGPAALAVAPAYIGTKAVNHVLFRDDESLASGERSARKVARNATGLGATAAVAGVGAVTVAGGASGAAIMSTLATVGGLVGGGAIAGTAMLAAAPVAVAAGAGFGAYWLWGGGESKGPSGS